MSCLEKDPARRLQSAVELSELLARVTAEGEWTNERARRWREVHRPGTAADPDVLAPDPGGGP